MIQVIQGTCQTVEGEPVLLLLLMNEAVNSNKHDLSAVKVLIMLGSGPALHAYCLTGHT
jgi:hypothetical protein